VTGFRLRHTSVAGFPRCGSLAACHVLRPTAPHRTEHAVFPAYGMRAASGSPFVSTATCFQSGPTGVTPLPHYCRPVRLPGPCVQVPVHRFIDRSFSTRHPQSPRRTQRLLTPAASASVLGFTTFAKLAALTRCNEAKSGSLALCLIPSPTQGFAWRTEEHEEPEGIKEQRV